MQALWQKILRYKMLFSPDKIAQAPANSYILIQKV